MPPPPYELLYTAEAQQILEDMRKRPEHARKLKEVVKALRLLEQRGPRYPGLNSHPYSSVPGPGGAILWESYVENRTPSAWRIWWIHGPGKHAVTIITIGPHP